MNPEKMLTMLIFTYEARYAKEKEQILAQAMALEKDRDVGRANDPFLRP